MFRFRRLTFVAALVAGLFAGLGQLSSAIAYDGRAEAVTVKVNMARILRINSPAATVVIGNPGIADVTIQDPQTLILTGKSYGETNLIVLDVAGNPIADTLIEVVQDQASIVTVFQGTAKTSVSCTPKCQPAIMLGDDAGYTSAVLSSSTLIKTAAE